MSKSNRPSQDDSTIQDQSANLDDTRLEEKSLSPGAGEAAPVFDVDIPDGGLRAWLVVLGVSNQFCRRAPCETEKLY